MTYDLFDARYARQLVLKGFGAAAQERLRDARVLIVGAGGLGSPAAMYLAAAGVGQITLVDDDVVDLTNLHRQLLYATPDVGRRKLEVARERLQGLNPLVEVTVHEGRLTAQNALALVAGHQVALDATDNFPTRYALNDACLAQGVPFVYGSVARFEGQVSVFAAPDGPCYRCLFPDLPAPGTVPTCAEEGVLGVVPGIIGLLQATEVIKLLTGIGTPLVGQLLLLDLLEHETQRIGVPKRPDCQACGSTARAPAAASRPAPAMPVEHLSARDIAARLASDAPPLILDVREGWEYDIAHLEPSELIPLSTLPARVESLDPHREYAILCHHGMRSEMAANWLAQQGFTRLINIDGGIDAWSLEVDPTVPRY
jgi:sulfur-carrier protein adenylyltransferase/sulfurtransferase